MGKARRKETESHGYKLAYLVQGKKDDEMSRYGLLISHDSSRCSTLPLSLKSPSNPVNETYESVMWTPPWKPLEK